MRTKSSLVARAINKSHVFVAAVTPVIRFRGFAMRVTAACALMATLLMTAGSRASAESPITLTVRLYNTSGIPSDQLAAARDAAETILRDTGINVTFRLCGRRAGGTDSCDEPLKRAEVVVRIIEAPAFNATLHPDAYGVTYIVKETNRGWLATVFSDRIRAAAERVGVDAGIVLGRVMAHEVGHLLLGIDYHGANGVMRAEWSDETLNHGAEDWRFSMVEAEQMQRVVASL